MVLQIVKQKQISFGYCDPVKGERVYPPPPGLEILDALPEQISKVVTITDAPESSTPREEMYSKLTCWPPLAQANIVASNVQVVQFAVLLETQQQNSSSNAEPEVSLWHNAEGTDIWKDLPLELSSDHTDVLLLNRPMRTDVSGRWFSGRLPRPGKSDRVVRYTVKYRATAESEWRWIKDATGIADGELCFQQKTSFKEASNVVDEWFSGFSSDITSKAERPQTDDTLLYSLACPINAAQGKDSGYQHHQLGLPKQLTKWFGLVRLWAPWLAPRQGKEKFGIDKDGVLLSFLRTDGLHVVCLAISGVNDVVTTFINDENGNVIIKGRNDRAETGKSQVLVAVADSFEVANAAVMYHARGVVRNLASPQVDGEIEALIDEHVKPEWLEEWYDGLTYCTWNGLGQKLTAQKIYDALDALSKENINITNLIIDDNWQSLSEGPTQFVRGWSDFDANKEGFPDGMKATTTEIRRRHPNVNHIAVWHAILGYWGGIDPKGSIAANYKTTEVEKEPGVVEGKFTVVAPEDAKRMYNDFYAFLSSVGVDSVKTDAQFFLDLLLHAPDRKALITEYQDAWTLAHLRHFSSRAISCMSQTPQILFHSQLPKNQPRLLVRNSDDFFPDVAASHPWHVFCNAHNSLFTQHLNVLPDWDMFQTSHEWAGFHAAARCVSGGPIYFTDYPGKHDIQLIREMTAQTSRDKTVILRPHIIGKATNPYIGYEDAALLKIGTYVGMARTGTGILGVFNVTQQYLTELISLVDFPGTDEGKYVVGSFVSGRFSSPLSRNDPHPLVGIELGIQGWDILTAFALRTLELKKQYVQVAMMGLVGKMTGCAAVTGYDIYIEDNGNLRIWTSLKALGVLGIYISDLASRSVQVNFLVLIFGKPIPAGCVRKGANQHVLEIDVEEAWKASGEKAGWSNEVSVEVFMH